MVLFLVAVVLLIVYQMKSQNSMDYLNHNNTLAINGIFVLLVFLSHCYSSLNITPTLLDESYKIVQWHMDQAIVIPFLFFSGYGIALSLKNKPNYIWSLLKVRLPKLLIHFDIAVVIYLIIQLILGTTYPIKHILLSLIGWQSVGNSNWYIFVMLLLYVFVIVGYYLSGNKNHRLFKMSIICTLFVGIYILVMRKLSVPAYFYNTIYTFVLGMMFPLIKDGYDTLILNNKTRYVLAFCLSIIAYIIFYKMRHISIVFYEGWVFFFVLLMILVTSKIEIKNKFLIWCGKNVFGLYILQRIPMMLLSHFRLNNNVFISVPICFICTLCLTYLFNRLLEGIDKIIFLRKV